MSQAAAAAAHGVRLVGLPATPWLQLTGVDAWPAVRVEWEGPEGRPALEVDTDARQATVRAGISVEEVVHPLTTGIGLHMAVARGFDAVHAGALVGKGGAWAMAGTKTAGKSTLLAACATHGIPVVADDALVFSGRECFAGPRCIDLRQPAAERLGVGPVVRASTPRHRLTLPPIAGRHALAGIIHLAWGDGPRLHALSPSESLERLLERRSEDSFPRDPVGLMDVAALPSYELSRPLDWGCLDETISLLHRSLLGADARVAVA